MRLIREEPASFRAMEYCSVALECRVILGEGMTSREPKPQ